MSNKKLGTDFENEFCDMLAKKGYWVHFLTPDKRGAQPFDVIAAKNNQPFVFDCKTSSKKTFSISRLEDNQILAFDRWIARGNSVPYIAVKYNESVYLIPYLELVFSHGGKINLEDEGEVYRWE